MIFSSKTSILGRSVVSGLAFLGVTLAGSGFASAQYDDPPARVARLAHLEGQVSIQPSGVDQWSQATSNYPVATGDRIYADQDGRSEISAGEVVARVGHSTDLTMTNLTDQLVQLGLAQGTLRVHTYAADSSSQVEVDTPNGAITVTQPGDIRIDSYSGDDGSIVTVNSGAVQITGPDLQQDVSAGQSVRLLGSNPIQISEYAMPQGDDFDSWSLNLDRHHRGNSQTSRYVNRNAIGSEDLDDYGSWSQTPEYGPVWYPQQVDADWAPYRQGHWVWTGPWGWTWVEDEPWGYAPFHYGRWVQVENRWGWMPGPVEVRPVWAPALVAFVGGGGFSIGIGGVSAWFPLGPAEPYHPWYHASDSYAQRVNVTNVNITVIHNTTVINNYNGYLQHPQDATRISNVNYANRAVAVTAMRQNDFASARSAKVNMVHVDPVQIQHAQIVAHPMIRPTTVSMAPRPVKVPVPVQRPTLLTQGGHQMQAVPGARSQAVPYKPVPQGTFSGPITGPNSGRYPGPTSGRPVVQNPTAQSGSRAPVMIQQRPGSPGSGSPNSGNVNPGAPRSGSQGGNGSIETRPGSVLTTPRPLPPVAPVARPQQPDARSGYPPVNPPQNPQQQRPLINRNEVPAPRPSFQQQQPALNQHPGRPLEPQQLQNLNQGRPAGPARDAEYPPHPPVQRSYPQTQQVRPAPPVAPPQYRAPQVREAAPAVRSAPPAAPAPEARPAPKNKDKQPQ